MKTFGTIKPPLQELVHFGVKGMRWGVRRGEDSASKPAWKDMTLEQKQDRVRKVRNITVGAAVAARLLFVVGSMAVATTLNNRAARGAGMKALEASNIMRVPLKNGVFKVTSL